MRFNCHTHVFTFKSVFTVQTVQTLILRLSRERWPDFVVEAVSNLLLRALEGGPLDEPEISRSLVHSFAASDKFAAYLKALNTRIPADVQIVVTGNIEGLAADALTDVLRRIGDLIDDNRDAENQTLSDLVGFLTVALKPTIIQVADKLFELSGPDTAVVALMMDITAGGTADEERFLHQIEDTSAAALAYPGRLLPFVAVNSLRDSHFARMEFALAQKGFVGVKLYPSLGCDMKSPAMENVFAYCSANDVPLLMHCNRGGFFFRPADIAFCDPADWKEIFLRHPALRVCFGHFGGDENLVLPAIPADSWTATIIALMKLHPGVYADIAYHTAAMAGGDAERNYFAQLTALLADPATRDRLLFGSDFFLVRQRLREDNLWRYFETHFTAGQLQLLTERNPAAFLGLPSADGTGARPNIQRHLRWLADHRTDVQRIPAEWALAGIAATIDPALKFNPSALGPAWSVNTPAHVATWQYFRAAQMYPSQQQTPFNAAGLLRLRDFMYWNKEHESAEIFANKCRLVSMGLDDALSAAPGVRYEDGATSNSARAVLRGALGAGDTTLSSFAAIVDRLYRFPTETVA